MYEYFVVCGERKKVLKAVDRKDLEKIIKRKFEIPSHVDIVLQHYISTYEDYVDIDSDDEFPTEGKINVLIKGCSPAITEMNLEMDQSQNGASEQSSSQDRSEISEPITPEAAASNNSATGGNQRWPHRFQLPKQKFSKSLLLTLSNKDSLGPACTTALMDVLYEEITNYTFFPTPSQYTDVVESLLTSYPHMRKIKIGDLTIEGDNAFRKWKNALSDKFRNMRKRRDKHIPQVAARKRITLSRDAAPAKSGRKGNQWGVKNFLPERPSTEDDCSINQAKSWLKMESSKRRPEMSGIRLRMDLTFADRRKDIVTENLSVAELKDIYPCLFMDEEVLQEFRRLSDVDLDEAFLAGLKKYGQAVMTLAPASSVQKQAIQDHISRSKLEEDRNRLTAYGCLLILPTLFKENLSEILCEKAAKPSVVTMPLLVYEGDLYTSAEFQVIVEDTVVAEPLDLIQGFGCLLATYYAFNIAYAQTTNNTLTFLQKCIVGLSDNAPTPRKVVTFMCKLAK